MKINSVLIGALIRRVRMMEGLSTAEFAKMANINPAGLNRIECPPKVDFRVSYDNLLNALELAARLYREHSLQVDFSEYAQEAYARETINLFLKFTEDRDLLAEKMYAEAQPKAGYVEANIMAMEKPVLDMLSNHVKATEYQRRMKDAHEAFCSRELVMYKDDPEVYRLAKADLPNKFRLYQRIKEMEGVGGEGSYMTDSEVQFQAFLDSPTVDNAMKFMEAFLGEIG